MTSSGRRRGWLLIGAALVAIGVLCVGYVGWELVGTTWLSQRRAEHAVGELRDGWRAGEPAAHEKGHAFAVVRIPRFGDDYAVPLVDGTTDEALALGFGHLEDSAEPGGVGNLVLAGHRITRGEPLRRMPELEPGDTVVVEQRDRVDTYVLDSGGDDLVVPLTDTWVTAPRPEHPSVAVPDHRRLLTLVTCAELFHTEDRLVAFGHLVSSTTR